jgi:hypothetical protein
MDPVIPMDCPDFLFFKQNLARATPVHNTGATGLVKVDSTYTRAHHLPMDMPTMEFLNLSTHSMLPRMLTLVRRLAEDQSQAQPRANGMQIFLLLK